MPGDITPNLWSGGLFFQKLVVSHVCNRRVQQPRQGRLDNHSEVMLFQGNCDFKVD